MPKQTFVATMRQHRRKHPGLLLVLGRLSAYSLALAGCMLLTASVATNLAFFLLIATAIELLTSRCCLRLRQRYWPYVLCIAGIVVCGSLLVHQVSTADSPAKCTSTRR